MVKTNFKDEKDLRNKTIHLAFSENELNEIDKHVGKNSTTRTAFIRDAIWRKITLKTSEQSTSQFSDSNSDLIFEYLEEIKKDIKRMNITKEIQGIFSTLKMMSGENKASKNMEIVDKVLKEHDGKLKITKLMSETGLNGLVYDVLAYYPEKYKINPKTNEVELHE